MNRKIAEFRRTVLTHYRKKGRHMLPWRLPAQAGKAHDPYRIFVSEIMLQQTQVERVIPYYRGFIKKFPTVQKLAAAPLSDVLRAWQGLGYNRRAKMLHEAAKQIVKEHGGKFPRDVESLEKLRGVGPYTARAVVAFAFNKDVIFIETNIRTAVLHHFFPKKKKVSDTEIEKILMRAFPKGNAREWYSALMDYGSFLKRSGVRTNHRIKGYAKQKAFKGSLREVRGAILRALLAGSKKEKALFDLLGADRSAQMKTALTALTAEGMIEASRGVYRLSALRS